MEKNKPMYASRPARAGTTLILTAAALALGLQACLDGSGEDDASAGTGGPVPQILFAAQEGGLASFDLASGSARPGVLADMKGPTDMQALEDGTVLVNLSGSNEILALDGKTMLVKARLPSSGGTAVKPVHAYITPALGGGRYWMSLNDGDGTRAGNSARFLFLDPGDTARYLKPAGEIGLGIGHHKAAFSPDKPRLVVSNISDCADIMSVFDYSDIADIRKIATLDAAKSGFDGSDRKHTCGKDTASGIMPSPHGCASAKANAHALCNETGTGTLVAVDLDAGAPGFKLIPTRGSGAGYTSAHPGGRYIYSLQSAPNETDGGAPCQIGQVAVVDMGNDSLVSESPLYYKGGDCADSLKGTPAAGAAPSHILFSLDGNRAFVNVASASDPAARASLQLSLDVSDPAHPRQGPSIAIGSSYGSHGETLTGDGKLLIVANNKDATVSLIDVASATVAKTLAIGNAGKTLATYGSAEGPGHQAGPFH
jgi:DNA-binding beta-propeller fold protein YncE